jgi:hypothetical protein
MRLFLTLSLLLVCTDLSAQTPIFALKSRGEVETKSFTISAPATLTISAKSDSDDLDEAYGVYVYLKKASKTEIETEEVWSLELNEKKRTKGQDAFRVRVKPDTYFFEISTALDGQWSVDLRHDNQKDAYTYRKKGNEFEISFKNKKIAVAVDEKTAKRIASLLNGANQ